MKHIINKIMITLIVLMLTIIILPSDQTISASSNNKKLFEFRGGWVATVTNIDIGRQTGTTEIEINNYKMQFSSILDVFEDYNMNTVIFQVRPINDAFYYSEINPISRFLIGTARQEGIDPGWDPMAWMIEECHKRGLEFHAWLNPYRASLDEIPETGDYETEMLNYLQTLDDKNFIKHNPDLLIRGTHHKGSGKARILLNPSEPRARQHVYDTIEEIIRNYNVDAIHFDDYFYSGVVKEEDNSDGEKQKENTPLPHLTKGDWRREQVNILVRDIHYLIKNLNSELDKRVEFGISPAGGWAPSDDRGCGAYGQPGGMPGIGCYSYSSYVDLFADTRKWVREEWIDYIIPQNYGRMYNGDVKANHMYITEWWAQEAANSRTKLYMGLAPYQYGPPANWPADEIENQMIYADSFPSVDGYAMYSISSLRTPINNNASQAMQTLKARWNAPVLNPIKGVDPIGTYPPPVITHSRNTNYVNLHFKNINSIFGYLVYRVEHGEPFNINTEPVHAAVPNFHIFDFVSKHQADNFTNYDYYIRAVYLDGIIHPQLVKITTGIYDNNVAPTLTNVNISHRGLFLNHSDWIEVTGEVYDENGDDLIITIRFFSQNYQRDYVIRMNNGSFTERVFVPPFTIRNGYILITVSDTLESTTYKTYSLFAPATNYTELIKSVMTVTIITNETIDRIFR